MKYLSILPFLFLLLYGCEPSKKESAENQIADQKSGNPPAEGFDLANSDQKAIDIADEVMEAMGGRNAWDNERYFTWNFFGRRTLWWDKQSGDVRIQMHNADSAIILINIYDDKGRIYTRGEELTEPDSVAKYMKQGKSIWINDAYWLFMPFKLKDSGVTLSYVGEDTTMAGASADVLQLTFKNVGNTPQNKYRIWVDQADKLVKQWAYYKENTMDEPNFITPWINYQKHGALLLSGDRGDRKITDIAVMDQLDEQLFSEF